MHAPNLVFFSTLVNGFAHSVAAMATLETRHFVGLDLGTSGARISIIQGNNPPRESNIPKYKEVHNDSITYSNYDDPESWTDAITTLLRNTPSHLLKTTQAICVSGTSASCMLVDSYTGKVSRSPRMYDYDITNSDGQGVDPTAKIKTQELIEKYVPEEHSTRAPTSALSKLIHYNYCKNMSKTEVLAHQSEYVANTIFLSNPMKSGAGEVNKREYISDWHNALKLGYDVKNLCYPAWLLDCLNHIGLNERVLPKVVAPGEVIGSISEMVSKEFGIHSDAVVVGGTTDSNAAFVAATAQDGAPQYGTAVTSLGSTLAIKMLSKSYVENSSRGVYSHRFPLFGQSESTQNDSDEAWLVGGASNVGCGILRKENFSNDELDILSQEIDVTKDTQLMYYPLTKRGERFPIADGEKEPLLTPKPESRAEYLKAILQGISLVEKQAFQVLGDLGADPQYPDVVWTCGGGSRNEAWIKMRQRILDSGRYDEAIGVKVMKANNVEASFGAAVLAASTYL